MTVFRAFYLIVKKNIVVLLMYTGVFAIISVMSATTAEDVGVSDFKSTDFLVAVLNRDQGAILSEALEEYIGKNAIAVSIIDTEDGRQDALFYRIAEYIVIIPEGFSESVLSGGDLKLEKMEVPGSYSGIFMDNLIDQYLNTICLYLTEFNQLEEISGPMKGNDGIDPEKIIEQTEAILSVNTEVGFLKDNDGRQYEGIRFHFTFAAYAIMAAVILGVSLLINVFNSENVQRRNIVSPIRPQQMIGCQIVGNFVLVTLIWMVNVLLGVIIYGDKILNIRGILMAANLLILCYVIMGLAFLVSSLATSSNARHAISNVIALGFSFISGVFVPLEMLGDNVKTVASFLPVYWYVKTTEEIAALSEITLRSLENVFKWAGIEILFGIAFLAVGMVVERQRSMGRVNS